MSPFHVTDELISATVRELEAEIQRTRRHSVPSSTPSDADGQSISVAETDGQQTPTPASMRRQNGRSG